MISMKMTPIFSISAPEMRAINRSAILEMVRLLGPIPRSKIADELHVSLPTVMRIVDNLLADGLVKETGIKEWSGGRKRGLVEFNGSRHLILGVDLGGTKIFGAVADLDGIIHYETHFEHHQTHSEESLDVVYQVLDELTKQAGQMNLPVRGIGIGVPGITVQKWESFPWHQL
jgi:DNA-binding Lrp family transcriptional regulator